MHSSQNPPLYTTRDYVLMAIAALALIAAAFVPEVRLGEFVGYAQFAVVILVIASLGWRRALPPVTLLVVAAVAGLPVYAPGDSGRELITSPEVGYLGAWMVAAIVAGSLIERAWPRFVWTWGMFSVMLGGVAVIYVLASAVAWWRFDLVVLDVWAYRLPGDLIASAVAVSLAAVLHRLYPTIIEDRWWQLACPPASAALRGEDVPVDQHGCVTSH